MIAIPASVPAANPALTPAVCLIDVRAADGVLVRRVASETADELIQAGLGEAIGYPRVKYVRLVGVDAGAALGLQHSSRTWGREQRQDARVKHNARVCENFGRRSS